MADSNGRGKRPKTPKTSRDWLARGFGVLALALFLATFVLLGYLWLMAWVDGALPTAWGETVKGHGPWRGHRDLENGVYFAFLLPILGFVASMFSVGFRPNLIGGVVALLGPVAAVLVVATHFWLIN